MPVSLVVQPTAMDMTGRGKRETDRPAEVAAAGGMNLRLGRKCVAGEQG